MYALKNASLGRTGLAKGLALLGATVLGGWLAHALGLADDLLAMVAVCTFVAVIITTVFFWTRRVAIALLGVAVLIGSRAITLQGMLAATELDIIFFLVGIMIIVAALKDMGFFTWLIQGVLRRRELSGRAFSVTLCLLAAVLSALFGEISAIVIVLALVLQVSVTLRLAAAPFVLMAVISTNIGTAATMLGNPVGVLIGNKAGFSFNRFLLSATPVTFVALLGVIALFLYWFRREIASLDAALRHYRQKVGPLAPGFTVSHRRGIFVLVVLLIIVVFHHQLENMLGLTGVENKNALLMITPLVLAAILMLARPTRAQHYVKHEVEWWTLLFFMLLFAIVGGLREQGVSQAFAAKFCNLTDGKLGLMMPATLLLSALGSAFMDSIVFVAAGTPVIKTMVTRHPDFGVLWWALLFGASFGSNIMVTGSTANVMAQAQLERYGQKRIGFGEWLKLGLAVGAVTMILAWLALTFIPRDYLLEKLAAGEPVVCNRH